MAAEGERTSAWRTLRVEVHPDGFAWVVFNRPDKLNTLSIELRRELGAAVAQLARDPQVRVLLLSGEGRAFTAGLDLDEWAAPGVTAAAAYEHDAVAALKQFEGPVIGAINGLAIAGGVEIALACDLLVASTDARFCDSHAKVGLLPGWGGSVRLLQRLGSARARELALTARFFSAQEALEWGFVNRVVPPERLRPEAESLAREILGNTPQGVVAYKRLLDAEEARIAGEAFQLERETSIRANSGVTREEIDRRLASLRRQRP